MGEANDNYFQAQTTAQTANPTIDNPFDQDWRISMLTAERNYKVTFSHQVRGAEYSFVIYDSNLNPVKHVTAIRNVPQEFYITLPAGTYFYVVSSIEGFSSFDPYTLSFELQP